MNIFLMISIPLTAALIGWITNYIAIKMLFRPQRPVRVLGLTFHGLVPRRQAQLAQSIAETVEEELISHKDIRAFLQKPENHVAIEAMLNEQIHVFLVEKLASNPMLSMFLQGEMVNNIREMFVAQFREAIPSFMESMLDRLESGLNFQQVIREKIEGFELSKLEEIIYRISAKELRTIELLGGVLGFFVGLFQVGLMLVSAS